MFKSKKRVGISLATAIAALSLSGGAYAQMAPEAPPTPDAPTTAPAPEKAVPAPNIDTNGDGKPDAWDKDGNGTADAWDTDSDGKPDAWDKDGDGKPDAKGTKPKP